MGDTTTKLAEQLFSDYLPKDIHALTPECKTALTNAQPGNVMPICI
jgi:hypothetical protein